MTDAATVRVYADKMAVGEAAAQRYVAAAREAIAQRGRFVVALSGGSTPQILFELLAGQPYVSQVDWARSHFFWGDERLVSPDDPGSNYYDAMRILLQQVYTPQVNIHRVRGEWEAEAAARDYAQQLSAAGGPDRAWPVFDLVLMGLGGDGHTASLFPGQQEEALLQPVMSVEASYEDRPAQRVTLTPMVFNDARHVLFLVTGGDKAEAVAATLQGPRDATRWPAQRIAPAEGQVTWLLDKAAAADLVLG